MEAVVQAEAYGNNAWDGQRGVAGALLAAVATQWAAMATPPRARGFAATCAIIIWRTSRFQCLFGYCRRDSRLSSSNSGSSNRNNNHKIYEIINDSQPPDVTQIARMQNNPSPQLPCKGILKTSRSFDKSGASFRKSAKFDELNVMQTFHPADKDYGHMKIDEPKTPYNYTEGFDENRDELDTELLVEKLRIAANTQPSTESIEDDGSSGDEQPLSEEERQRRREFERRRKAHYREFEAVKLARKLIQEEDDDDDDEDKGADSRPSGSAQGASSSGRFASSSAKRSSSQADSTTSPSTSAGQNMDLEPSNN
ncbi:protein phosphatase inhibitor 2 isoform X2 [Drosophila sechellia]|uniref:GM24837 n=2 Tax=Drosophila sechellia TaxID=7238 RepID=B4HLQ3_DROSE|nr:protein phosphatase inhibitor 2 isoform X2 [Drosophila sechellia]EDW40935.1 GM24837 [Drosophila sechellia]